jgi:hypothetical protein
MTDPQDYNLFFRFLETYAKSDFRDIDVNTPLMLEMEKFMDQNNQFFYVADVIQMKILFTSKLSYEMIGIQPSDLGFHHFMEATHPEDIQRLNIGRTTIIKKAQDIFIEKGTPTLVSTNFRIRNGKGKFSNFLIQGYLFYAEVPLKTVYFFKLHTKIDWCKKIRHGYHYYIGNDLSYFRYPDLELLNTGNVFTKREFEIIKLIAKGLNSEQIAAQLFLSIYTVNTHRGNILKKTRKGHISDLIYDLKERGLL